uniref:MADF domain-containing protein n=1 Tax=Takifugu rubripes TaxID=31033 RepID=A0A3B5KF27_TAKRU
MAGECRLITAVSGFPCLYDRSSPTYRDLNMRGDAWREVSQLVGVNETDCRRKWKMLRDQHRRERYRERERRESGVGLLNYRPWRYAAILSFLNPFIDARAAGTNGWALDPRTPQQDMVGCSMNMEMRSDDDDSYGGTGSSCGLLEDCPKRGDAQREQDVEQRDHVTLFLLSLAPAIRRLPAEKQSWVKTKVQQIVHEADDV